MILKRCQDNDSIIKIIVNQEVRNFVRLVKGRYSEVKFYSGMGTTSLRVDYMNIVQKDNGEFVFESGEKFVFNTKYKELDDFLNDVANLCNVYPDDC